MKILYIIHQFYPEFHSGTERFLLNLSSAIQKAGHFPHIVTYSFVEDKASEHAGDLFVRDYSYKSLLVVALKHRISPIDLHISCRNEQIYKFALEFLQKEQRCDLMHIAHSMRLASFAEAALQMGIPYLFTLTDFFLICPKIILQTSSGALCTGPQAGEACRKLCSELSSEFIQPRLDLAQKLLYGAKSIVAPSKFLAAIFNKEFPDLPIRVIPHGMDLKYLKPQVKTYRKKDKIVFGYCGGLSPHKGVHLLIKAFRNLHTADADLRIYGAHFHEAEYYNLLQNMAGTDKRIRFCGPYKAEDIGSVLATIDVIVVPSLCYESYSLVTHEALACNVPVIASNIGGAAEKIQDFVNGFTFRNGDEKDLESKMKHILDNVEELNKIRKNMKEYISPLVEEEAYIYERLYRMGLSQP
jgi:glycosyltransferase involved in cell wall biosynthesis